MGTLPFRRVLPHVSPAGGELGLALRACRSCRLSMAVINFLTPDRLLGGSEIKTRDWRHWKGVGEQRVLAAVRDEAGAGRRMKTTHSTTTLCLVCLGAVITLHHARFYASACRERPNCLRTQPSVSAAWRVATSTSALVFAVRLQRTYMFPASAETRVSQPTSSAACAVVSCGVWCLECGDPSRRVELCVSRAAGEKIGE